MRLTIARKGAGTTVLGGKRPPSIARQEAPVVRVLGVEAAFLRRSYLPGEPMELRILADAGALTLQFLHCGAEYTSSERNDEMVGRAEGRPGADRLDGQALGAGHDHGPDRRLADRPLHGSADDGRRPRRLRAVRAARCHPRPAAPARRPADEHVAGVQHVRPRRRRLGRHVVRGRQPTRRARPPVPRPRRAAPLQGLRPRVPALAAAHGEGARHGRRRRSRGLRARATTCARSTTSSSSRGTAST